MSDEEPAKAHHETVSKSVADMIDAMKRDDESEATKQGLILLGFGLVQLARIADACERWAKAFEHDNERQDH